MDEERMEGPERVDEQPDAPEMEPGIAAESDRERSRAGLSRWTTQFAIGVVVAGGLVFGFGKRAELSSAVILTQARQDMQRGLSVRAARALEQAHKQVPGDRAVTVALVEAYYRAGEPETARPLQNQLVLTPEEEKRIQPLVEKVESTVEAIQQGADLLQENQYDRALPLLQRASKDMPDSPLPHAYLIKTYAGLYVSRLKLADLQSCQAAQRRLAEIDPKLAAQIKRTLGSLEILPQVITHTNAADAALKAGNTEAALPELEAADKLYPNSAMVHALRAIVHAQRFEKTGSADEKRLALDEYRTAVQLNPSRVSMLPRLGKLAKDAGD